MISKEYISAKTVCTQYGIEFSFVDSLWRMGLIEIHVIKEDQCIHQDQLADLEKMIRLHNDLNVNLEGIDVVFNLLEKEQKLRSELIALQNRLRRYESDV